VAIGPGDYEEITADSWARQVNDSPFALGNEMLRCWSQSSGHWDIVKRRHAAYGAGVARGYNNVWYSCVQVKN
jgi:uncharacterized protein YkwD